MIKQKLEEILSLNGISILIGIVGGTLGIMSIFIDWNYDGETMRPEICDIPGKDELVTGVYEIPDSAGRIKIKITDLLSESLEMEV